MTRRTGFALPMAILALALMTAAVIAAFSSTTTEIVTNSANRAQNRASQLAEAGLQQFMLRRGEGGWCSNCVLEPALADSEWTRVNLAGGYANVVAMRVRPKLADGTPSLFFIRSTGVDTTAKMSGAGLAVYATRTVGQYATFATAGIKPISAWTSLNGISSNPAGNQVPINGGDECVPPAASIAATVVPSGGGSGFGNPQPSGSPAIDATMTLDSLKKRVGIDWNAIVNYDAIPADITIPPDANWPANALFNDTAYWPVIRIKKSFTVPNDGRGLIIADSNLSFTSNNVWDGVVLVGGRLVSTGSDTTAGAVISGLNRTLPGAVNPLNGVTTDNDALSNSKRFRYNSCKAARASERVRVYFAWFNTWSDNVAIW